MNSPTQVYAFCRSTLISAGRWPNPKRLRVGFFLISAKSCRADLFESSISLGVLDGLEGARPEDLVRQALGGRGGQLSQLLVVQGDHRAGTGHLLPLLVEAVGVLLQHLVPLLLLHLEEELLHHLLLLGLDAVPGALRDHDLVEAQAEGALDP